MSGTDEDVARRTVLKLASVATASAGLAGCLEDGGGTDEPATTPEDGPDDEAEESPPSGDESDEADDGESTAEPDDEGESGDDSSPIEPGTEILFSAQTTHWEGLEPAAIEGRENPTLVLEAGAEYTIGWADGDGQPHHIEIRDDDDAVVDGLSTELSTETQPSEQTLTITASEEMSTYVCDPHGHQMRGQIDVRSDDAAETGSTDEPDDEGESAADGYHIEPGTEITLSGQTSHWEGVTPSEIEGRENPTLVLEADAEYAIGMVEGNGQPHNVGIRGDDDEVVDGLETELVVEPEGDRLLEFTASSEMVAYVCDPHQTTMRGTLRVE
ncbi:plastocyanin/azurin family copper-binding protein [Natrinema ejinorense]|uniref:plastocyanin/azurin family copper-binding protein n=1 Tax=Natrinema ejinorense TaxID=373386 RepID=UPI00117E5334|nr:plastocyanin/azurin family copper-binding protein [Natrinema ejinorense]